MGGIVVRKRHQTPFTISYNERTHVGKDLRSAPSSHYTISDRDEVMDCSGEEK